LIGPQGLLLLGAQVLATLAAAVAQKWGLFAGRPSKMPTINQGDAWATGSWDPKGSNTFTFTFTGPAYIDTGGGVCHLESRTLTFTKTVSGGEQLFALDRGYGSYGGCSNLEASPGSGVPNKEPIQIWGLDRSQGLYGTRPTGVWFKDFHTLITVKSNTATSVPYPDRPTAWPAGYVPAPVPSPETLPPTPRPAIPGTTPLPLPVPEEPATEPAPNPLPAPQPVKTPTLTPPLVVPGQGTQNGALVPPTRLPVPTTPSDAVFPIPGRPGIPGNGPAPDLTSIAQELGRIETKLHWVLNPPTGAGDPVDWLQLARILWDLLNSRTAGTTYTLTAPCDLGPDGNPLVHEVTIPDLGNQDALVERVDALAELLGVHQQWKQRICVGSKGTNLGAFVTVRFRSMDPSPGSRMPVRKELHYRDATGATEADHIAHWLPFEWQAGPAITESRGASWGVVQVWALNHQEGRRVIQHAAAIAGVDLTVKDHLWVESTPRSSRFGQTGRMRVEHTIDNRPCISKRSGSSGTPSWRHNP
jgi:hypothetical protein